MNYSLTIRDRVAVVTGAGSGCGRAIAATLAAAGAKVVVTDLNELGAEETVTRIREQGGQAESIVADVSKAADVARLQAFTQDSFGLADLIVNNAGWTPTEPFLENSLAFIEKIIAVNYTSAVLVCQQFLRPLVAAGRDGRVVNISSGAGRIGNAGETVYAGAKGGVNAFTKSLAREMAKHAITVNCIAPGAIDTPLLRLQSERMLQHFNRAIPLRRLGQPQDIANGVMLFAADQSAYLTGQILSVDGGLTMVD
ncbi:SDR family oxidoreductase [Burkholderia sp. Ac-20384]|uniref:3-oxoacyl-[acyl-carrier-protein] reductase FabG n=1 Tax=Burkholderia lata (strain ATCC 17760 / DSM 23089 / LMG 22485 / NCIMB 9086 / R18194 / 383) TaxID=482957 RepID=A0A833PL48_BURL3|nr:MULTISPECIES: SDR family NAD(P)-dependent oxidoreductase [Burkholderia]KAF1032919.1 MAG: 3-oxoacyl-[acyl-carrier-protein] reductase FabG [Burkholderia lata]MBN3822056.1 SDR family oxidoreductase [Burkholderia sp. Ac-20384]VWB38326.1 Short-chain dehydrogenase/reductase SDR [Burkholderia lata]